MHADCVAPRGASVDGGRSRSTLGVRQRISEIRIELIPRPMSIESPIHAVREVTTTAGEAIFRGVTHRFGRACSSVLDRRPDDSPAKFHHGVSGNLLRVA